MSRPSTGPIFVALLGAGLVGCAGGGGDVGAPGEDVVQRANELARRLIIADSHIDVPYRLQGHPADVGEASDGGDFDWPRARAGGLDLAFMSIYVPAEYQKTGGAAGFADSLIDMVESIVAGHPDRFALVVEPAGADEARAAGKLGLALGMENGEPIDGGRALRHFFERGVRYVTLTHSENNRICDSSYADASMWGGLSPFGRELIGMMNDIGMMIDVSHVSDEAFDQVLELSRAPVIASHSSCRHFTPDWERNLDDDRIRRLAAGGGVMQINFGSSFLRDDARLQLERYRKAREAYRGERGLDATSPELDAFRERWFAERPQIFASVADVADHIDHVVRLVGIDHVGLGSDFDGVGDSLPTGLKDVSDYPNLIAELLRRGYSDEEVEKICAGNLFRVWREVTRVAADADREG